VLKLNYAVMSVVRTNHLGKVRIPRQDKVPLRFPAGRRRALPCYPYRLLPGIAGIREEMLPDLCG
jgi:hypothetical protein